MRYTLIEVRDAWRLVDDVNNLLKQGWKLHGNTQVIVLTHSSKIYCQALTIEEEETCIR